MEAEKITFEKSQSESLLVLVLKKNYRNSIITEVARRRQQREASHAEKTNRLVWVAKSEESKKLSSEDISRKRKLLEEKTIYIQKLEEEIQEMKAKRQRTLENKDKN